MASWDVQESVNDYMQKVIKHINKGIDTYFRQVLHDAYEAGFQSGRWVYYDHARWHEPAPPTFGEWVEDMAERKRSES